MMKISFFGYLVTNTKPILMKNQILLILGAGVVLISMLSSGSGVTGQSISGCSCHGAPSTNTQVTVTGQPMVSGYEPGETYTLAVLVYNANKVAAGFNMSVSDGTLIAGAGSTLQNGELTHSAPVPLSSGGATFIVEWQAPAAAPAGGDVTFNVSANAVNGDASTNGDEYFSTTVVASLDTPEAIRDYVDQNVRLYPVPAQDILNVESSDQLDNIQIFSTTGQLLAAPIRSTADGYQLDVSRLSAGSYILMYTSDDARRMATFTK